MARPAKAGRQRLVLTAAAVSLLICVLAVVKSLSAVIEKAVLAATVAGTLLATETVAGILAGVTAVSLPRGTMRPVGRPLATSSLNRRKAL